jgi:hypothetical protein
VSAIEIRGISRTSQRIKRDVDVPGGYGVSWLYGVKPKSFTLDCQFATYNDYLAKTKFNQIEEMCENAGAYWGYLTFPQTMSENDGFYLLETIQARTENWHGTRYYPFTLNATRIGNLSNMRLATFWESSAVETYSWASATLTSHRLIGLPVGSTNVEGTVINRTASSGTIPVLSDPSKQDIFYVSSPVIGDWGLGECRVYDSDSGSPILLTSEGGLYLTAG